MFLSVYNAGFKAGKQLLYLVMVSQSGTKKTILTCGLYGWWFTFHDAHPYLMLCAKLTL